MGELNWKDTIWNGMIFSLEHCRVMSSARRPLWLRWTNASEYAERYFPTFDLIFKYGDGNSSVQGNHSWHFSSFRSSTGHVSFTIYSND